MAAIATFALKAGVWFRRGRLLIVSPDSRGTACPLSGRNSTYRPVQILEAGSEPSWVICGRWLPHEATVMNKHARECLDRADYCMRLAEAEKDPKLEAYPMKLAA